MKELKVGVVGLGWAAGAHIEGFKLLQGARVTAVCSRRKLDKAALEDQYKIPLEVFNDYDEMLASDIDMVDICTPPPFHAKQTIAAAQAGKHILLEKAICVTFDEAKAMRKAIRKAGVKTCVCFECRFSKHFTLAKSIVDQGLLGSLHFAEVDYYHGIGPWYKQFEWSTKKAFVGSSLLSAGCHAMDILLFLMGDAVVEVTSYATKSSSPVMKPYEFPSTTCTILKFKNGQVGKVASCVDCFQPYYFHTHLVGSEGSLLDNKFYSHKLAGMVKNKWSTLETELVDSGDVKDHPYREQFQVFVDSVHKGVEMPLTDFETAFESHRVCFAADLSAARGRPVRMSEMK
ncbi:MAG TPA: Gfo/Idh/MocA family oxidoreductase [Candidatus Brocadiia bacterium]|nr:Gfo/Idh/MocA family oxidoreductase [Candidatus Brocadiia bacterium]